MVRPRFPAPTEVNVTSSSVNYGDIVLVFSSGVSLSGVSTSELLSREGSDGGFIRIVAVTGGGTLSSTANIDVIHTGSPDAIDINTEVFSGPQYKGTGYISDYLNKGDIFLQWDEDDHGNDVTHMEYDANSEKLYSQDDSVARLVRQAEGSARLEKTQDNYVEHEAVALSIELIRDPTSLSAEARNDNTVDLSWSCALDPHHFRVERKRKGNRYNFLENVDGSLRALTDNDVSSGVEYLYRLQSAQPVVADYSTAKYDTTKAVRKGDLIVAYEDKGVDGISYDIIANTVGENGVHLKVFLMKENGTVEIREGMEVIYTGGENVGNISSTRVKLSSSSNSLATIASSVQPGALIIQWSGTDAGNETGYWSFTGKQREMYVKESTDVDARIHQVFDSGDLSRDANGVEIAMIELDFDSVPVLDDKTSDYSNEDLASPSIVDLDIR